MYAKSAVGRIARSITRSRASQRPSTSASATRCFSSRASSFGPNQPRWRNSMAQRGPAGSAARNAAIASQLAGANSGPSCTSTGPSLSPSSSARSANVPSAAPPPVDRPRLGRQLLRQLQREVKPGRDLLGPAQDDVLGGRGLVGRVHLDGVERPAIERDKVMLLRTGGIEGADPGGIVPALRAEVNALTGSDASTSSFP